MESLKAYITGLESVLVCYSGGTDSTMLFKLAADCLGDKAYAVFFETAFIPQADKEDAIRIAANISDKLLIQQVDVFSVPGLSSNPEERCYLCKLHLLSEATKLAQSLGLKHVLEGSHADDLLQHRPGRRAIKELSVKSPFEACGIGKMKIRSISKELGLATWDKPSYSCLATRLPNNEVILEENLRRIERLENYMKALGFKNFRVRHNGHTATLELSAEDKELYLRHVENIKSFFNQNQYLLNTVDRK